MPVFSSVYYYAGILNYTSGIVVWDLDWVETSPGIPPYIDNTGLPPEQVGVVFTDPELGGGARGTATVTATVDGIPALAPITALVPLPLCSYFDYRFSQIFPGTTSLNWVLHPVYRFMVYVDSLENPPILLTFDPNVVLTLDQLTDSITSQLPPGFSCFLLDMEGEFGPPVTHLIIQRTNGTFAIIDNDGTEYPTVGYNYGVLYYSGLYFGVDDDSDPISPFGELLPLGECLIPPPPPPYMSEWWGQSSESGLYTDYSGFHGWDVLPWYLYRVMVRRNSLGSVLEFIPDTNITVPTSTWNPVNVDTTGPSLILDDAVQGRWILDPEPAWFQGGGTFTIFGNNTQELIYDLAQPSDSIYLNASWYQYIPPEVGPPSIELVLPVENYLVDENGPNITDNVVWYKFTVDGDYTVSAGTLNSNPSLDTLIGLYDQAGELIIYNDDFQDYLSFIEANITAGQYFIAIGMYPTEFNQSNFSVSGIYAIEPGIVLDIAFTTPPEPPPPPPVGAMVMTFDTDMATLAFKGATAVTVSWGDGSVDTMNAPGDYTHIYSTSGIYTVWVSGTLEGFGDPSINSGISGVTDWGALGLLSLSGACSNAYIPVLPDSIPSSVIDVSYMFENSGGVPLIIELWDVSNITDMQGMFKSSDFNGNIGSWNVINVTDMSFMFQSAYLFNKNLNSWNTASVTNMNSMFRNASNFNSPIDLWNTSSVTDMGSMFRDNSAFNQPVNSWNVSSVTDMSYMFSTPAYQFNQNLNSWNTANVVTMKGMFKNTKVFNGAIGAWDTSSVTDMSEMFMAAEAFNQSLNSWNTSLVTDMSLMFRAATAFNGAIDAWDTSSVTNMSGMFYLASLFNQPINSWNVSSVTDMSSMFRQMFSFNQSLNSWNTSSVTNMSEMFRDATAFNGNISTWNTSSVTNIIRMFFGAGAFNQNIGSWNISNVDSLAELFSGAIAFNQDIGFWNTSLVTDMSSTFSQAYVFNEDIGAWDTSNVTTMRNMFSGAQSFNYSLNSWTTSNVTDMYRIFSGALAFNSSIESWDTSSVTTMEEAFSFTNTFNLPLNSWDTSSVTTMRNMFFGASVFNRPLSSWNVSNVTNMSGMFRNTPWFDSDITTWNTGSVTSMDFMFQSAWKFNQNIGTWDTSVVSNMNNMFNAAEKFNQDLSGWCVSLIPVKPPNFDGSTFDWVKPGRQPVWGTCP